MLAFSNPENLKKLDAETLAEFQKLSSELIDIATLEQEAVKSNDFTALCDTVSELNDKIRALAAKAGIEIKEYDSQEEILAASKEALNNAADALNAPAAQ